MGHLRFTMVKPGGNNTVLVHDLLPRQYHGDFAREVILKQEADGEQVGYLEHPTLPTTVCRLQMMGDEFCGNASRSLAFLIAMAKLAGDAGPSPFLLDRVTRTGNILEVPIEVSGYKGVLNAVVYLTAEDEIEDIIVPMPVRREADCTEHRQVALNGSEPVDAVLVHLHGISHLLIPEVPALQNVDRPERKRIADGILTAQQLRHHEAAGVIFYEQRDGQYVIDPYVYVRDSNTLYDETACGSGTTALALHCAKQLGSKVVLSVMQPSGLPIGIMVDYDGQAFLGASISGPVEVLRTGTVETNGFLPEDAVRLHRVTSAEAFDQYAQGAGVVYDHVFRDEPYLERFTTEQGASYLRKIAADPEGLLFVAMDGGTLVGFCGAIPLDREPDIVEHISGHVPVVSSYYMAELGVAHAYRGRNLSHELIDARLNALPEGFDTVVVRTSVDNTATQHLYRERRGFQILDGVRQWVDTTKWDQASRSFVSKPDERLFLVRKVK